MGEPTIFQGGWGQGLAGTTQSVPRAELSAVLSVARRTRGSTTVHTDSKYVVDGFLADRHLSRKDGDNMDLWGQLGQDLEVRQGGILVKKVKGVHKDDPQDLEALIKGDLLWEDFVGNLCADRYAGDVAASCQVPEPHRRNFREATKLASSVQLRIAAALAQHNRARPEQKFEKRDGAGKPRSAPAETPLQRARRLSPHMLVETDGCWNCTACGQSISKRDLGEWLKGDGRTCTPIREAQGHRRGLDVAQDQDFRVAASRVHPTHSLSLSAETLWCAACGAHTAAGGKKQSPKNLLLVCRSARGLPPTRYGSAAIERLLKGLPPRAGEHEQGVGIDP